MKIFLLSLQEKYLSILGSQCSTFLNPTYGQPPYPQGTISRTPSGYLKPSAVLSPMWAGFLFVCLFLIHSYL